MFNEDQYPIVPLSGWRTFQKEFSPFIVDQVIDRENTRLPDWFMPLARGIVIPSKYLLRRVGYRKEVACRLKYWYEKPGFFQKHMGEISLTVRQCDDDPLWTIEQLGVLAGPEVDEVLTFSFGATPFFTRSPDQAKWLAEYCHKNGPPHGLLWSKSPQHDLKEVVELARKRRREEAACSAMSGPRSHAKTRLRQMSRRKMPNRS